MKSCIYEGRIRHRRFSPKTHKFTYSLYMMYMDLDELPVIFKHRWLWSIKRFSLAWFRRKDHLYQPATDLVTELKQIVFAHTGKTPQGPIRLLTHLRHMGVCFNPLSLFYCFDKSDENVEFIVAEVNNTPWGERHCYVLHENLSKESASKLRFRNRKKFHVSPFIHMDLDYHWYMIKPSQNLIAHIENISSNRKIFDATLTLQRREINSPNLAKMLLLYPLISFKVIILIYCEALRLWLKRIPFLPYKKDMQPNGK